MYNRYAGFFRAKVIDNQDDEYYGRVKVYIPALMTMLDDTEGIWAFPANIPIGGIDPDVDATHYQGSVMIPAIGCWVWIFFEDGNPHHPFYFGGIQIKQTEVVSENRVGNNPTQKYTIYKTNKGRVIILSDDDSDERVELTGKKRQLQDPPSGDTESVYNIKDNQTTILIDEREGKEKILISDYKENYICLHTETNELHIDAKSDIIIQSSANILIQNSSKPIQLYAKDNNISLYSGKDISLKADDNIILKANNIQIQADTEADIEGNIIQLNSNTLLNASCKEMLSMRSTANIVAIDGANGVDINDGTSQVSTIRTLSVPQIYIKQPKGDRDS